MKRLTLLLFLCVGCVLAEDFSVYPLTPEPLEFSTRLEPFQDLQEGYALEFLSASSTLEPFSMQYVYPDEATLYSMQFVEPDPTTKFSMYKPESIARVPEFELELPNP